MEITIEQKRQLDTWYNRLTNRLKENVPHWRESDYAKKQYMFENPTENFIAVTTLIVAKETILKEFMTDKGIDHKQYVIKDFELTGSESEEDLAAIVTDLIHEEHTEKCESKNVWRYEQ